VVGERIEDAEIVPMGAAGPPTRMDLRGDLGYLQVVPYDPRLAALIVARVAEGQMLGPVIEEYRLSWGTINKWKKRVREFGEGLREAQRMGAQKLAEETVEIADELTETMMGSARNKLRVETRMKLAAKYDPERYGDKADVESAMDWGKVLDEMRGLKKGEALVKAKEVAIPVQAQVPQMPAPEKVAEPVSDVPNSEPVPTGEVSPI